MPGTGNDTGTSDELYRDAAAAATQAYTITPGNHETRLTAVIAAHLVALAERGLLAVPPPGAPVPTIEEDAQWLAGRSGHPRWTDGGWRLLLDREGDILMAYRLAAKQRGNKVQASFGREARVRDRLLLHASRKLVLCW